MRAIFHDLGRWDHGSTRSAVTAFN